MNQNPTHEIADDLSPTRRSFYIKFIYGAMTAIGAALAAPAAIYLLFPPKVRKEKQWVDTVDVNNLTAGKPEEIAFQRTRVDGWKVTSESHRLGSEKAGQPNHRFRAAVHSPRLRVSLG